MNDKLDPLRSLKNGRWFKLICGASFQHLPAVRTLTLAYTLAGADCIDVAADPAVIAIAQEALQVAKQLATNAQVRGVKNVSPILMVSLNDGEDPHFRKAEFNPAQCPSNCSRPCEKICPAQAIVFNSIKENTPLPFSGVISQKCYGCGRCIPACPYDIIYTESYVTTPGAIAPLVLSAGVDAVEIHTKVGRLVEFSRLWQAISPWVDRLKLLAISCPDGEGLVEYLRAIYEIIASNYDDKNRQVLIWQTDGRPMSGDIGDGATLAAVKLGQKVLAAKLPGYVQLAGGTNSYTVPKLQAMGLLKTGDEDGMEKPRNIPPSYISGVAYGSYARVLLSSIIEQLELKEVNNASESPTVRLEENKILLEQAVELASTLVSQMKSHVCVGR